MESRPEELLIVKHGETIKWKVKRDMGLIYVDCNFKREKGEHGAGVTYEAIMAENF